MKNWIISIALLFFLKMSFSQTFPEGMSYQAQVFSSTGAILSNATIGVEFNVRSTSMSGPIVWQEMRVLQ